MFPGVYARTSEEWNWIRATVCNNSDDPPAQYRCDEGGATFSPRPTSTPTAPTASPAPSGKVTEVLVTLVLDSFVSETGFQIKDQDGDVVFGIEPESYSSKEPGATVSEIVSLNAGAEFTLTLLDSFGDGFSGQAVVYLGIQEDMSQVLAYYDGSTTFFAKEYDVPFSVGEDFIIAVFPSQAPAFPSPLPSLEPSAPTFSPAPTSPEALVLLRIALDGWPSETGWRLETADGDVIKEVLPGTYTVGSANVRDEFTLRYDEMYNLVILDSFGDGLQGEVVVYFESEKETAILAYFSSALAIFSTELSLPFLASIEGVVQVFPTMSPTTPTGAPSAAPSAPTFSPAPSSKDVEIYLTFITDAFPIESGYVVSNNVGETIAEVEAGRFEEPFLAYNQTIVVSENEDFLFTITDTYGDGFDGTVIAYFGDEPAVGKVIMFYGPDEGLGAGAYTSYNLTFRSSGDATIPIFPTSAPTLPTAAPSGAPSAPSISPAPSDSEVAIFVVFTLDLFPTETGYSISQTGEVVHEVPPGTYGLEAFVDQSEVVLLKRDQEFNFTIFDSYGDGFGGTVAVYLGEEVDNSMLLAYYEGPTGEFTEFEVGFATSGSSIIQIFPTMAPSAPTGVPSDEPSAPTISPSPTIGSVNVSIVIELDSYPAETGWRIETLDGTVIAEVEAGTYTDMRPAFDDDATVLEGVDDDETEPSRAKEKLKKEKQANVRTGMFVPTQIVTLQGGVQYTFVVTDSFGDGFRGQATVYLGEIPAEDQVLVHHDGTSSGGFSEPYSFVTTPEGVLDIAVQPPREFEVNVALEFPSILLVWQLQDENGKILAEKTPLGPLISPVTVSFVHAGRPKMLVFTIENQFQAELTGSYSISTENEIVAMGDQGLGVSRVHYFEVGATAGSTPVTAFARSAKWVDYDLDPPALSWDFSQVGEAGFVETYFSRYFDFDGSMATTSFIPQGELYNGRFYADSNVIDSYHMTVGSAGPFQGQMLLANQPMYTFVAEENYTKPVLGDDYLLLEINFGANDPAHIGWLLYAGAVQTSQIPVAPSDAPVTAAPSTTVTTASVTAAPSVQATAVPVGGAPSVPTTAPITAAPTTAAPTVVVPSNLDFQVEAAYSVGFRGGDGGEYLEDLAAAMDVLAPEVVAITWPDTGLRRRLTVNVRTPTSAAGFAECESLKLLALFATFHNLTLSTRSVP